MAISKIVIFNVLIFQTLFSPSTVVKVRSYCVLMFAGFLFKNLSLVPGAWQLGYQKSVGQLWSGRPGVRDLDWTQYSENMNQGQTLLLELRIQIFQQSLIFKEYGEGNIEFATLQIKVPVIAKVDQLICGDPELQLRVYRTPAQLGFSLSLGWVTELRRNGKSNSWSGCEESYLELGTRQHDRKPFLRLVLGSVIRQRLKTRTGALGNVRKEQQDALMLSHLRPLSTLSLRVGLSLPLWIKCSS